MITNEMKCEKISFTTKAEANQVIKASNRSKNGTSKRKMTKAYKCTACGNWHMTSKERKEKKMRYAFEKKNKKEMMNWAAANYYKDMSIEKAARKVKGIGKKIKISNLIICL